MSCGTCQVTAGRAVAPGVPAVMAVQQKCPNCGQFVGADHVCPAADRVLQAIMRRWEDTGEASPGAIAAELGMSAEAVAELAYGLEEEGLVLIDCDGDEPLADLRITPTGEAARLAEPITDAQELLTRHARGQKQFAGIVDLPGADLSGAWLPGVDLRGANLEGANLQGANLVGADLSRANLGEADLSRADLSGANLTHADLHEANLRRANLPGADLRSTVTFRVDLGGAALPGARLYDLRRANLAGADLSRAVFGNEAKDVHPGGLLAKANLEGANLAGADLRQAYVGEANLKGANLAGADVTGANLRRANLVGATMPGGAVCDEKIQAGLAVLYEAIGGLAKVDELLAQGRAVEANDTLIALSAKRGSVLGGIEIVRATMDAFDAGFIPRYTRVMDAVAGLLQPGIIALLEGLSGDVERDPEWLDEHGEDETGEWAAACAEVVRRGKVLYRQSSEGHVPLYPSRGPLGGELTPPERVELWYEPESGQFVVGAVEYALQGAYVAETRHEPGETPYWEETGRHDEVRAHTTCRGALEDLRRRMGGEG